MPPSRRVLPACSWRTWREWHSVRNRMHVAAEVNNSGNGRLPRASRAMVLSLPDRARECPLARELRKEDQVRPSPHFRVLWAGRVRAGRSMGLCHLRKRPASEAPLSIALIRLGVSTFLISLTAWFCLSVGRRLFFENDDILPGPCASAGASLQKQEPRSMIE